MAMATLTSKGQITIPKLIRDEMGLKAGDRVHFFRTADGSIVIQAKKSPFEEIMGMLKPREGKRHSIAAIDDGIRAYIRKKHRRAYDRA